MIYYDKKRNMLMESEYRYELQERETPHLYREMFPYEEIPKCTFNQRVNPIDPPDEIWLTDTTFRDGQQSRAPYTPEPHSPGPCRSFAYIQAPCPPTLKCRPSCSPGRDSHR